jgi:hypothetical protein
MIITISNEKYIIGNNHDMGIILLFFIILMLITKPNCRCRISSNSDKNLTLFLFLHDFRDEKRFKNYVSFCWYIRLPEMARKRDKENGFTSCNTEVHEKWYIFAINRSPVVAFSLCHFLLQKCTI